MNKQTFLSKFVIEKFFRESQIIMTLSIPDKTKANAKHYVETSLPRLIEECKSLLLFDFIFQLDGASA